MLEHLAFKLEKNDFRNLQEKFVKKSKTFNSFLVNKKKSQKITKKIYRDPSILPSLFGTSGVIMSSTSWLLGTSLVSGTCKVKLV